MRIESEHGSLEATVLDGEGFISDLNGENAEIPDLVAKARLYFLQEGCTSVFTHVDVLDERRMEVYEKRWGMKPVAVILRSEL